MIEFQFVCVAFACIRGYVCLECIRKLNGQFFKCEIIKYY